MARNLRRRHRPARSGDRPGEPTATRFGGREQPVAQSRHRDHRRSDRSAVDRNRRRRPQPSIAARAALRAAAPRSRESGQLEPRRRPGDPRRPGRGAVDRHSRRWAEPPRRRRSRFRALPPRPSRRRRRRAPLRFRYLLGRARRGRTAFRPSQGRGFGWQAVDRHRCGLGELRPEQRRRSFLPPRSRRSPKPQQRTPADRLPGSHRRPVDRHLGRRSQPLRSGERRLRRLHPRSRRSQQPERQLCRHDLRGPLGHLVVRHRRGEPVQPAKAQIRAFPQRSPRSRDPGGKVCRSDL